MQVYSLVMVQYHLGQRNSDLTDVVANFNMEPITGLVSGYVGAGFTVRAGAVTKHTYLNTYTCPDPPSSLECQSFRGLNVPARVICIDDGYSRRRNQSIPGWLQRHMHLSIW